MQNLDFRTAALMVSVIIFGTMLGGGIYAAVVYFPPFLSDLPNSAVVVTGRYGLSEGYFWVPIHLLNLISLVTTMAVNWKTVRRRPLLIGFGIYISVLVATQFYFLPELGRFSHSATSNVTAAEWLVRTKRWQMLNYLRAVVLVIAQAHFLLALTRSTSSRSSGARNV